MSRLTLTMVVSDAVEAMEFYEECFGGTRGDVYIFSGVEKCNEAHITVGDVSLRLVDANDKFACFPPKKGETDSIWLAIEVTDCDKIFKKALQLGAKAGHEPLENLGILAAQIRDPFGYTWTINEEVEKKSFEERFEFYEKFHNGEKTEG